MRIRPTLVASAALLMLSAIPAPAETGNIPQLPRYQPPPPGPVLTPHLPSFQTPGVPSLQSGTPSLAPFPVAMLPPPGETPEAYAAHPDPASTADPDYERVVQDAFAARDRRQAQADKLLADAQAARKRMADQLAALDRLQRNAAWYDRQKQIQQSGEAEASRLEQQAAGLRPRVAPPLSDAEKNEAARRKMLSAPSSQPGLCQALVTPPPTGTPLDPGVVCACVTQYGHSLRQRIGAIAQAADAIAQSPDFLTHAKTEKDLWDHPPRPLVLYPSEAVGRGDAIPPLGSSYPQPVAVSDALYLLHNVVDLALRTADVEAMCKAVEQRQADPRRRLLPPEVAQAYAPGGRADSNVKTEAFSRLEVLMQALFDAAYYDGMLRVALVRDAYDQTKERFDFYEALRPIVQKAMPPLDDIYDEWRHPRDGQSGDQRIVNLQARAQASVVPYVVQAAGACQTRLDNALAAIGNAATGLASVRRRFLDLRQEGQALLRKDMPFWDALASRDGFPQAGSNRSSFSATYSEIATIGHANPGPHGSWLFLYTRLASVSAHIGYVVRTSRLEGDQFWVLGGDLCGERQEALNKGTIDAYARYHVRDIQSDSSSPNYLSGELSLDPFDVGNQVAEYYASGAEGTQRP